MIKMAITIVESADLNVTYQCPLCKRFFYFDNDYIKHKCAAKRKKLRFV